MKLKDFKAREYDTLTDTEIKYLEEAGVLNGYGGARQSWLVRKALGFICRKFKRANADKHDFGYWKADTPRRVCDEKFYIAMIEDMIEIYDREKSKTRLLWNAFLCTIAWSTIHIFGYRFYGK